MKLTGRIDNASNIAMQIVNNLNYNFSIDNSNGNSNYNNNMEMKTFNEKWIVDALLFVLNVNSCFALNLSLQDSSGHTLLHYAIMNGYDTIFNLLMNNLNYVDINIFDLNGLTALHFAAIYNREIMVDKLISNGAIVWVKDENGRYPWELTNNQIIIYNLQKVYKRSKNLLDEVTLEVPSSAPIKFPDSTIEETMIKTKNSLATTLWVLLASFLLKFWKDYRIFLYILVMIGSGSWMIIDYILSITLSDFLLTREFDTNCNPPSLGCSKAEAFPNEARARAYIEDKVFSVQLFNFGRFSLFLIMLCLALYHLYCQETLSKYIGTKFWLVILMIVLIIYILGILLIFVI